MADTGSCERKWLLQGLCSLFEEKRHCDIDICVGTETFSCHKVILSAASMYFDAMFSTDMQESKANSVRLNDIDGQTFADLLNFVYTGNDVLTHANVESMLHAACLFQMRPLQDTCERFLIDQISSENVIGFWALGTAMSCENLIRESWMFILSNFKEIAQFEEFLKLEKTDMLKIIADDNLFVENEETVCEAAMRWVKERPAERRDAYCDILSVLRLTQISLPFLLENIYSLTNIHTNPCCMRILKDAVKYHALPEKRHMYSYPDLAPRNTSGLKSLFIVLGRRQTADTYSSDSTDVLAYDAEKNLWYAFTPLPVDVGDDFATCPYGNDIFVSGGTANPEAFLKYCAKQCKWLQKPGMFLGRYRHCMLAMKDSIFCVGGYNCGTVGSIEEFDMSANTWQKVGKLRYAVDSASTVVHDDTILVFGGWEGFSDETSAVQCFNTTTRTCTVTGHLPLPQKDCKSLSFNDRIYVVFSTGEIMQYDPILKSLEMVTKVDKFHRKKFGLHKSERTLNIIGGTLIDEGKADGSEAMSSEVVSYPIETDPDDRGTIRGPLPAEYEVYGCHRILVMHRYPLVEFSQQFVW